MKQIFKTMRRDPHLSLLLIVACATIFVGCNRKNSDGAPLPRFEEYSYDHLNEGVSRTVILFQRIKNADKSDALAIIDTANYRRTFAERIDDSSEIFDFDAIAEAIHSEISEESAIAGVDCEYRIEQVPILAREGRVVCFETSYFVFLGGAHGFESLIYDCYDVATGSLYDFGYLVEDEWGEAMRSLIYNKVHYEYGEAVFMDITPENIHIPESVLITESGLMLVYQPYDIAPYSEGILSVQLSDEAIAATGAPLVWIKDFEVVDSE